MKKLSAVAVECVGVLIFSDKKAAATNGCGKVFFCWSCLERSGIRHNLAHSKVAVAEANYRKLHINGTRNVMRINISFGGFAGS